MFYLNKSSIETPRAFPVFATIATEGVLITPVSVNVKDQYGGTALSCSETYPEIKKLLRKAGAKE